MRRHQVAPNPDRRFPEKLELANITRKLKKSVKFRERQRVKRASLSKLRATKENQFQKFCCETTFMGRHGGQDK